MTFNYAIGEARYFVLELSQNQETLKYLTFNTMQHYKDLTPESTGLSLLIRQM